MHMHMDDNYKFQLFRLKIKLDGHGPGATFVLNSEYAIRKIETDGLIPV